MQVLVKGYLMVWPFMLFMIASCSSANTVTTNSKNIYHVADYGILPYTGQDNTTALQQMLNKVESGAILIFEEGVYDFKGTVTSNKEITIRGSGERTIIRAQRTWIKFLAEQLAPSFSMNRLPVAQKSIAKSVQNIPNGTIVCFSSQEKFIEKDVPYPKDHCNLVGSSFQKTTNLEIEVPYAFNQELKGTYYRPNRVTVSDITIVGGEDLYQIEVYHRFQPVFHQVNFQNPESRIYGASLQNLNQKAGTSGVAIYGSVGATITDCHFENVWYGVLVHKGCLNTTITNCTAYRCHHLNNFALGSANNLVQDCTATACEGGFDAHPTAINSEFVRCRDVDPTMASKFRGRVDIIRESHFAGGIELFYDSNIGKLFGKVPLGKKIYSSTIEGRDVPISGPNVEIIDTDFTCGVRISNSAGYVRIKGCQFKDARSKTGSFQEMLTIGNQPLHKFSYNLSVVNCSLTSESGQQKIGLYFPGHYANTGLVNGINISGFDKGVVLYGGPKATAGYDNLVMQNVTVQHCRYGVFSDPYLKKVKGDNLRLINCSQNINDKRFVPLMKL